MRIQEHFKRLESMPASVRDAAHAVGLDRKAPYERHGKQFYKPYRNFYAVPKGGSQDWEGLEGRGYATRDRSGIYHLTREGLDWLGDAIDTTIYDETF